MLHISEAEVRKRMSFDNPWWDESAGIDADIASMPKRTYFESFYNLVTDRSINRAVVLMGPRRVGKTIMIYQAIERLIERNVAPKHVIYVPLDAPLYNGLALQKCIEIALDGEMLNRNSDCYVFFDEIQYLKDWEIHLKSLVDSFRNMRFVVSGSAAAALKLKSNESGAGRFTDYSLPPLTFYEYLLFTNQNLVTENVQPSAGILDSSRIEYEAKDISKLNAAFIEYINYGGYPEAVMSKTIRSNIGRYIRGDIIDKVLLRDLPSLYGIDNIPELNAVFTRLAYNTGNEVSIESISKDAGIAKNTVRKFLEYFEAAFLIVRIPRIDDNARHFKRVTQFKVYLTNPSLRAALFEPVDDASDAMGALVKTAVFSQWFHSHNTKNLHYARWDREGGEVDLVYMDAGSQTPRWAVEIKWTNRFYMHPEELRSLAHFMKKTKIGGEPRLPVTVTTRTESGLRECDGLALKFLPAALYCYTVGRNLTREKDGKRNVPGATKRRARKDATPAEAEPTN
jgi:predicted AAA+ superfamily ATPase